LLANYPTGGNTTDNHDFHNNFVTPQNMNPNYQPNNSNMTSSIAVPGLNRFSNNPNTSNMTTSISVPGSNAFSNTQNTSMNGPSGGFGSMPNNNFPTFSTPQNYPNPNSSTNFNIPNSNNFPNNSTNFTVQNPTNLPNSTNFTAQNPTNMPNSTNFTAQNPTNLPNSANFGRPQPGQNQFQNPTTNFPTNFNTQLPVPTPQQPTVVTANKPVSKEKKKDPQYIQKIEKAKEFAKKGVAELDYKRLKQAKENLIEALRLVEELDKEYS